MSNYNILSVFDGAHQNFNPNVPDYAWNNPYGGSLTSWDQCVYLLTDDLQNVQNQGKWDLTIEVTKGDTINWLDTPLTQGAGNTDFLIYAMKAGSVTLIDSSGGRTQKKWSDYLSDLQVSTGDGGHGYVAKNFDPVSSPPSFVAMSYTTNQCSCTVNEVPDSGSKIEVTYFIKVARINTSSSSSPEPEGWYTIDPKILIKP